jgi:hypothetical protein
MSSADNGDVREIKLKDEESKYDSVAHVGGIAVVLGLVIEVILTASFPRGATVIEEWGPVFADMLIAAGVATEVIFAARARSRAEALKVISDQRVADARTAAAQAHEQAAALEKEAAEARERTAQIEKLTAWRRIDAEFRQTLSDAFRDTLSIIQLRIEYQQGDPEAFTYAREFAQTFTDLGVEKIVFLSNAHLGVTVFGVAIEIGECEEGDDLSRACLAAFGVEIKPMNFGRRHSDPGLPTPNLYMFVGAKPPNREPDVKSRESSITPI